MENELRKDGFFTNIATEREETKRASLGYARKILTILYEHKWEYEDFEDLDDEYSKYDEEIDYDEYDKYYDAD